ncbi:MAG: hypothetical protein KDB02_03015 [Acidimicrobiales bacterium]|nr:hypothetical protein [Acidimicrobiales bacterium]
MIYRSPDAIDRSVGSEVLVIRGGESEVHRLSGPVGLVWAALATPGDPAEIADRLAESAPDGVDVGAVVEDCIDVLDRFGLIARRR